MDSEMFMEDNGLLSSRCDSKIRAVNLPNSSIETRKLTEWGSEKSHRCRFLGRQTHILDLPYNLLTEIILAAVKSSDDGPRYFSRIRTVCKDFLSAAEDEYVLKAIKFDRRQIKASWQHGFLGHINSLAYRCAGAGNDSAHCLLAEEVVLSACEVLGKKRSPPERVASASFFLSNFDFVTSPEYKSYECVPRRSIHHVEVVRTFFLECSPEDVLGWVKIKWRFALYCMHFSAPGASGHDLMQSLDWLCRAAELFQSFKESIMGLSHPWVEIEFSRVDARVRAATEELKAGVEINISWRDKLWAGCERRLKRSVDELGNLCLESDRKVSEVMRVYRKIEEEVLSMFQICKANVVSEIDGYFLGSPKPRKLHIKDASAFQDYYYPVFNSEWSKHFALLNY